LFASSKDNMMISLRYIFILVLAASFFTSCEKDGLKDAKKDSLKEDCFYLSFPIIYELPDGSKISLKDEKDESLKEWYEDNPSMDEKPSIIYPVEIKTADETIEVSSDREFAKIKESCDKYNKEKKDCFDWVYPIGFTMPDGSQIILNDTEDSGLKNWYEDNIDEKEKPVFNYPVNIINKDGTLSTLENNDDLDALLKDC